MNPDFVDLLRAFIVADGRFLVVGAYALAHHGRPRACALAAIKAAAKRGALGGEGDQVGHGRTSASFAGVRRSHRSSATAAACRAAGSLRQR